MASAEVSNTVVKEINLSLKNINDNATSVAEVVSVLNEDSQDWENVSLHGF